MSFFKKFFLLILINIFIFLSIEIVFTIFFVVHKTNYYGSLAKLFLSENKILEKTVFYEIKYDKLTGKYIPGDYSFNDIKHHVNKFGFIGEEIELENKTGCRIVSLGGSTTAGTETKEPYPKILEKLLRQNNYNCEVLNFGFSGKALNFLEDLLVDEVIKFNPNIVTIMNNRNSTMYNSYTTSSVATDIVDSKYDLFIYEIKNFLFLEIMTYRFMNLAYNRLISLFLDKENKILSPFNPTVFHSKKYFETGYKNQILRINSYCKAKGIKLLLIKQAYFIDPDFQKIISKASKEDIIKKLIKYNKEKINIEKTNLFWIYTNAILNKTFDEIKSIDENIILVDPTDNLYAKNKKDFFLNDGLHLNINGNRIIAKKIFENLVLNEMISN